MIFETFKDGSIVVCDGCEWGIEYSPPAGIDCSNKIKFRSTNGKYLITYEGDLKTSEYSIGGFIERTDTASIDPNVKILYSYSCSIRSDGIDGSGVGNSELRRSKLNPSPPILTNMVHKINEVAILHRCSQLTS